MSRLSTRPHMCPWPQCLELVPHTQLFCKAHWFRIPQPERVELNAAVATLHWVALKAMRR